MPLALAPCMLRPFALLFALLVPACSAASPAAAPSDSGDDTSSPVVEATSNEELGLPAAHALPLTPADVLRLSDGDGVDLASAVIPAKDGSVVVVFDRFDPAFTRGSLFTARSSHGRRFTKPVPLERGRAAFVVGPSAVVHEGSAFVYHEEATALNARPTLFRSAVGRDGKLGAAERLPPNANVTSLMSWAEATAYGEGVQLAFRGGADMSCHVALSDDGLTFAPTAPPCAPGPIAMAASASFANGTLAFSHQNGVEANMISYVTTSKDRGATWSTPLAVSLAANVHDTSFVERRDGGLDLYFIYPPDAHGFSLFRRALTPEGVLGPEQRVTQSALGEPSKPHAARLADGRLLLSYAEIAKRDASGQPSIQRIVLAALDSDAPLP